MLSNVLILRRYRHVSSHLHHHPVGSPLRRITEEQGAALAAALRARGLTDASVYVGMRYWHPYTEEAMEQVRRGEARGGGNLLGSSHRQGF